MSILKWLLLFAYLSWFCVIILAFLNPSIKALIPLIVCSTGVVVCSTVIKDD